MVTGAVVTGAVVTGAVVTGAVVTGAVVTGAVVTGAVVTGAVVTGAVVTGAAVSGTAGSEVVSSGTGSAEEVSADEESEDDPSVPVNPVEDALVSSGAATASAMVFMGRSAATIRMHRVRLNSRFMLSLFICFASLYHANRTNINRYFLTLIIL